MPSSTGGHSVDAREHAIPVEVDLREREGVSTDGFDIERFAKLRRKVLEVVADDRGCTDVNSQRKDVAVLLVDWHRIDQRVGYVHQRLGQRTIQVADSTLDCGGIEVRSRVQIARDLVEDLRGPVRTEQAASGHCRHQVGHIDPVEDVRVEDDDVAGQRIGRSYSS